MLEHTETDLELIRSLDQEYNQKLKSMLQAQSEDKLIEFEEEVRTYCSK